MRTWMIGVVFLSGITSLAALPVPDLHSRVTDGAAVLSSQAIARLDRRLASLEQKKGAQLAVLTIRSLDGEAIEDYSMRVAEAWKPGRKGVDDGVLLLVAVDDHRVRIEVGYGLEGILPDAVCRQILDETILPRFRSDDYEGGIEQGVDRIAATIETGQLPPVVEQGAIRQLTDYRGISAAEGRWFAGSFALGIIGLFTFVLIFQRGTPFLFMYFFLLIFWCVFPFAILGFGVWKWLISFYVVGVPLLRWLSPSIPGLRETQEWVSTHVSSGGSGGSGWSSSSGGFSGGGGSFGGGGASGSW